MGGGGGQREEKKKGGKRVDVFSGEWVQGKMNPVLAG